MSNVKLVWNYKGFGEILKSQKMQDCLREYGEEVKAQTGDPDSYLLDIKSSDRAKVFVYVNNYNAERDNMDSNTLLRALGKVQSNHN